MARPRARRSYNSPLRDEQVALSRTRILEAGRRLFVEPGYGATTIAELARAAGVSVQTVYNTVGPKPAVLKAVYDVALAGDEEPVPLVERPAFVAMLAEPDPRQVLARYAAIGRGIAERTGPLAVVLLAQAGQGDPDLRAFAETIERERLTGTRGFVGVLAERSALRPDLEAGRAADILWTLISPEVYDLLVNRRGWSLDAYESWLAATTADALLGPPPAARRSRSRA